GGCWPLSMWLTPDRRPFFGGTYFPPRDRHGLPGFLSILRRIHEVWRHRREDLLIDSLWITEALAQLGHGTAPGALRREMFARAFEKIRERLDPVFGGFEGAPKFPQPSMIRYLLHLSAEPVIRANEPLHLALLQLRQMARGGIYDALGGGFA